MKDLLKIVLLFFIFLLTYIYRNQIIAYVVDNFIYKNEAIMSSKNSYSLNYNFDYIKETNNFTANNKQEIFNIFYTFLNNGEENFYFYCNYDNCESDVTNITKSNEFTVINNFLHPYNTYKKLYISINSWRKINVDVQKSYTKDEINKTNKKLSEIINKIIKEDMTDKEKITVFHDYIINNTYYDTQYTKKNIENTNSYSHRASGPLLTGKALCGGYSQAMSLFLNYFNIPNYRISSDTHIWNLVYLDDNWYHIDLTWDDPITSNNSNILLDKYLLITSKKLNSYNTGYHNYNTNIYTETNSN